MSFFHIPANCHGAISNGRCVQAFNTGIKGVGIAMQDHTLHTASPFSNCSIYIIGTFVLVSSGNNNNGTCITHKTAKSDCFKNSTIRCVAAGCIPAIYAGFGAVATTRKPLVDNQRHCLLILLETSNNVTLQLFEILITFI
jgi:hypothetical protein